MPTLARPVSLVAEELRTHWIAGREVVLSLSERCEPRRARGWIVEVALTDAYCLIVLAREARRRRRPVPLHVPIEDVEAIHLPHFHQEAA